MTPQDFAKELLRSKALDVPAAGARARAIGALEQAAAAAAKTAAAAGAGAAAAKTGAGAVAGWLRVTMIAAAAAGAAAATTYGVDHAAGGGAGRGAGATSPGGGAPASAAALVAPAAVISGGAGAGAGAAPPSASTPEAAGSGEAARGGGAAAAACGNVSLPERAPARCSTHGKQVWMELTNRCSAEAVDVYWVSYECREIFRARVAPGAVFRQMTSDGHPWRVRDHATGKLLKEFVAEPVPGAPDLPFLGDAGTFAADPVLTILRDDMQPLPDGRPPQCSGAGYGARGLLRVKNERRDPALLMWVDHDCHEVFKKQIAPGAGYTQGMFEGDAWRLRAADGGVLTDLVPNAPDTTTYVTVP